MFNIARYLCLGLGAVLILVGWMIINSRTVQENTVQEVGRIVAMEMIGDPAMASNATTEARPAKDAAGDKSWSFLGPQIGRWAGSLTSAASSYLSGIVVIVIGAALAGLAVPSGRFGGAEALRASGASRACYLMLGMAGLFLACGFASYFVDGFRGGKMFLGTRSAMILLVCAMMTALISRHRATGFFGYYAGLLLTPALGLNFLRLALKRPVTLDALDVTVIAKALMAAASLIAIILLWRAIPGGIERAKMSLQVRRLAAGAGAAVLLAGICITKASVLPKHALAEGRAVDVLDNPEIQETLAELGVPQDLIDTGRKKLADMGTGIDDMEELQNAAVEVLAEWERANPDRPLEGRSRELVEAIRSRTSVQFTLPDEDADLTTPQDLQELLQDLSPSDMQKLATAAGIDADLNDPKVREKITQEINTLDVNDPQVQEALAKAGLDQPDSDAGAPIDISVSPATPEWKSMIEGIEATAQDGSAVQDICPPTDPDQPMSTRPLPNKVSTRVPSGKVSGGRLRHGERPSYLLPPPPGSRRSQQNSKEKGIPLPYLLGPSTPQFAHCPDLAFPEEATGEAEEGHSVIVAVRDGEGNGDPGAQETPTEADSEAPQPAVAATAEAAPPPPPPAGPDQMSRLQQHINNTSIRASGYGLLATLIGAIVFLTAVLMRRVGRKGEAAPAAGT